MAEQQKEREGAAESTVAEGGDFAALLNKEFKPQTERARTEVQSAVRTLAEQALTGISLTSADAVTNIKAIIAELDHKLSDQVNEIIHQEEFQDLESAWRGLHHLVNNSETDQMLKIRVMNISKKELSKTLKRFKGTAWDQSPIFKKIYEQ
jgi:type VI secretion system protein ImpC